MEKKIFVSFVSLPLFFLNLLFASSLAQGLPGWLNCVTDDFGNMTCAGSTQVTPSDPNMGAGSGAVGSQSSFEAMGAAPQAPVFRTNEIGPPSFGDPFPR